MKPSEGAIVGFLVGLAIASLGAYKDTTFEGFNEQTFWRSPLIAAGYGALGTSLFPKNESKVLLAGFAGMSERLTVETWKATYNKTPGKFEWGAERDRGWLLKRQEDKAEVI